MSLADDFLKEIGDSGLPTVVDNSLADTWSSYDKSESPENPMDRILSVLGFFYLVRQAGMKRLIKRSKSDPSAIYNSIREEQFAVSSKEVARQLVKFRLLDVFRVYRSKFDIVTPIRGDTRAFKFDLCLETKRNEPLDSALTKLQGMLYHGDLPRQLAEVWKKLPVSSKAKPKSALPRYNSVMSNSSIVGFAPLYTTMNDGIPTSIFARRAADNLIVIRILIYVSAKPVPWLSARKHDEVLKSLLSKAFLKLKG